MKKIFLFLFLCITIFSFSQSNTHSVYLIGDAGEYKQSGAALLMLKKELLLNPNSTVLFLGDNVYPEGLNIKDSNSVLRLKSQLRILKEYKGNVFFVPGNHDWAEEKRMGLNYIIDQQKFVASFLKDSTSALNKNEHTFLPQNALPGPASVLITKGLRIIFIDTQWFLHFHKKNKIGSVKKTKIQFYKSLDSLLNFSKQTNEQVIIAAHHPIYSNGWHSTKKQPFRFLINYTPFKIFGWIGLDRLFSQDIDNPSYKKMRKKMLSIVDNYYNITYVSGHDHNMQYFKNKNRYIVSGCGSKLRKLSRKKRFDSIYQSDDKTGFIKIDFKENKSQSIEVYRVGGPPFLIEK